jgi:hypothetical protein
VKTGNSTEPAATGKGSKRTARADHCAANMASQPLPQARDRLHAVLGGPSEGAKVGGAPEEARDGVGSGEVRKGKKKKKEKERGQEPVSETVDGDEGVRGEELQERPKRKRREAGVYGEATAACDGEAAPASPAAAAVRMRSDAVQPDAAVVQPDAAGMPAVKVCVPCASPFWLVSSRMRACTRKCERE